MAADAHTRFAQRICLRNAGTYETTPSRGSKAMASFPTCRGSTNCAFVRCSAGLRRRAARHETPPPPPALSLLSPHDRAQVPSAKCAGGNRARGVHVNAVPHHNVGQCPLLLHGAVCLGTGGGCLRCLRLCISSCHCLQPSHPRRPSTSMVHRELSHNRLTRLETGTFTFIPYLTQLYVFCFPLRARQRLVRLRQNAHCSFLPIHSLEGISITTPI